MSDTRSEFDPVDLDAPPKKRRRIDDTDSSSTVPDNASQDPLYYFNKIGRIFMAAVVAAEDTQSKVWRDELAAQSSDDWFDELKAFIPTVVKHVFNKDRPPTVDELCSIPYDGQHPGVYCDVLKPKPTLVHLMAELIVGCTTHRPVQVRRYEHDGEEYHKQYPDKRYYQLKHGTEDYISYFISLSKIPTVLDSAQAARRRMLCQLSEALFNMWLRGFDTENDHARDLTPATKRAFKKAYGIEITDVDYVGLATHSPLKERTGREEYGTVQRGRYEEAMQNYAEACGGIENVPPELEKKATRRSLQDTDLEARDLVNRRSRVKKALRLGIISQQLQDAAEVNDWYPTPGFPSGWLARVKDTGESVDLADERREEKYEVNKA